jgi:hypothetical protein
MKTKAKKHPVKRIVHASQKISGHEIPNTTILKHKILNRGENKVASIPSSGKITIHSVSFQSA